MHTENASSESTAEGLAELSERSTLRSALLRVVSFAREWHGRPGYSIDTLPEAVGAELRYVALPASTSILGLSICPADGPPTIVLNEELIEHPGREVLTLCHEAFHVVAGFQGIARCDNAWKHDPMERLAWLGPSLFMVPEPVGLEVARAGFDPVAVGLKHEMHTSLVAQRTAIAVVEGKLPGNVQHAMEYLDASAYSLCAWSMMAVPPRAGEERGHWGSYDTHPGLRAAMVTDQPRRRPDLFAAQPFKLLASSLLPRRTAAAS